MTACARTRCMRVGPRAAHKLKRSLVTIRSLPPPGVLAFLLQRSEEPGVPSGGRLERTAPAVDPRTKLTLPTPTSQQRGLAPLESPLDARKAPDLALRHCRRPIAKLAREPQRGIHARGGGGGWPTTQERNECPRVEVDATPHGRPLRNDSRCQREDPLLWRSGPRMQDMRGVWRQHLRLRRASKMARRPERRKPPMRNTAPRCVTRRLRATRREASGKLAPSGAAVRP